VAWGWPIWRAEESALEHYLHHSQPKAVIADFGLVHELDWHGGMTKAPEVNERLLAHENHDLAGGMALLMVVVGLVFASLVYYYRVMDPQDTIEQVPFAHRFLHHKWYFDELYSALLVRPALAISNWCRAFDATVIDGSVNWLGRVSIKVADFYGAVDRWVVDGAANLIASVSYGIGNWLRNFQTGYIRSYVLFLVLAAVGIWVILYNVFAL
jgi:NADH-quinone oxidoreductase subunit L